MKVIISRISNRLLVSTFIGENVSDIGISVKSVIGVPLIVCQPYHPCTMYVYGPDHFFLFFNCSQTGHVMYTYINLKCTCILENVFFW